MLSEYIRYDPSSISGLTWIKDKGRAKRGDSVGYRNSCGHWQFKFNGKQLLCHRVILHIVCKFDLSSPMTVDHKDRNKDNNLLDNLMVVDKQTNCMNRSAEDGHKLGVRGVYMEGKMFIANISIDKCQTILGRFNTLFEAVCARKSAENTYYNLPEDSWRT